MEQSLSLQANGNSATQKIPRILWNLMVVHYSFDKNPPLVLTPIQMHQVHTFPPYFPKITEYHAMKAY
jgi:hypothetical protein